MLLGLLEVYLQRKGTPARARKSRVTDVLVYETLGGLPGFKWLREPDTGARIAFRANDPVALVEAASAGLGLAALIMAEAARSAARTRVVGDFLVELMQRCRAAHDG